MGTRFVAKALTQDGDVRVVPFQFNIEQAYALELGQAYMRPAALGGLVLEEGLAVTAITKAANAQVTIAYHGYEVGDQVYFEGITGMVEINGRFLTVASVVDANNFTLDHDTTGYGTFTGSGGGTVRVGAPPAPPTPPVVPAPATPAPEPDVGSGSGGGYDESGEWVHWEDQRSRF